MVQISAWQRYQEDVAAFFRQLGFDAHTDVTMDGVRTKHAIDVLVRSVHVGFPLLWLIECKQWNTPVPKLHVLGFREIVSELGADRGIIMSESGFQSGTVEAAHLSNVHLSSLEHLRNSTSSEVAALRLQTLYQRYGRSKEEFWDIPKYIRMAYHLRVESVRPGEHPGMAILYFADAVLSKAVRGSYPIEELAPDGVARLHSAEEVIAILDPLLISLQERLDVCLADKDQWPKDEQDAYDRVFKARDSLLKG